MSFNDFRFGDLGYYNWSNQYFRINNRVNEAKDKIIVKVDDSNLIQTMWGYAVILDATRVVFVKFWQVSHGCEGTEVMLTKQYFNVKTWGNHDNFGADDEACTWDYWLNVAESQKANIPSNGLLFKKFD